MAPAAGQPELTIAPHLEALDRHISPTPDPGHAGVVDPIRHPVRRVKRVNRRIEPFHHGLLEKLVELGHIQKRSPMTDGVIVYGAVARVA